MSRGFGLRPRPADLAPPAGPGLDGLGAADRGPRRARRPSGAAGLAARRPPHDAPEAAIRRGRLLQRRFHFQPVGLGPGRVGLRRSHITEAREDCRDGEVGWRRRHASWAATGTTGFCWTRPRPRSLLRRIPAAVAGRGTARERFVDDCRSGAERRRRKNAERQTGEVFGPARHGGPLGGTASRRPARGGGRRAGAGLALSPRRPFRRRFIIACRAATTPTSTAPGQPRGWPGSTPARDTLLGALGQGRRRG